MIGCLLAVCWLSLAVIEAGRAGDWAGRPASGDGGRRGDERGRVRGGARGGPRGRRRVGGGPRELRLGPSASHRLPLPVPVDSRHRQQPRRSLSLPISRPRRPPLAPPASPRPFALPAVWFLPPIFAFPRLGSSSSRPLNALLSPFSPSLTRTVRFPTFRDLHFDLSVRSQTRSTVESSVVQVHPLLSKS